MGRLVWKFKAPGSFRRSNIFANTGSPSSHPPLTLAALTYKKHVDALFDATLVSLANGWYNGANIPGKKREAYNYIGGVAVYKREIAEEIERGYPGFQREVLKKL